MQKTVKHPMFLFREHEVEKFKKFKKNLYLGYKRIFGEEYKGDCIYCAMKVEQHGLVCTAKNKPEKSIKGFKPKPLTTKVAMDAVVKLAIEEGRAKQERINKRDSLGVTYTEVPMDLEV